MKARLMLLLLLTSLFAYYMLGAAKVASLGMHEGGF